MSETENCRRFRRGVIVTLGHLVTSLRPLSVPYRGVAGVLEPTGSRSGERPLSADSVNSPVNADYPHNHRSL